MENFKICKLTTVEPNQQLYVLYCPLTVNVNTGLEWTFFSYSVNHEKTEEDGWSRILNYYLDYDDAMFFILSKEEIKFNQIETGGAHDFCPMLESFDLYHDGCHLVFCGVEITLDMYLSFSKEEMEAYIEENI